MVRHFQFFDTPNPVTLTSVLLSLIHIFHGGVFENFQNSDTNAADFFSHMVNEVKMNNFGIYMGCLLYTSRCV